MHDDVKDMANIRWHVVEMLLQYHPAASIDVLLDEARKIEAYAMGTDILPPAPVALPAEAVVHNFDDDGRMIPKADHAEGPVPVTLPPHTEETAEEHHGAPVTA